LKCRLCSADIINYENPPHYNYNFIAKEIDRYFEIVDYVQWLQFSGGEPFMNKELPQMIEKAMEYSYRFDKLMIFSNGTILPNKEIVKAMTLNRDKIQIFISHYGSISNKAEELIKLLEDHDIEYAIKKYYGNLQHHGGWVDFGGWKKRNLKDDKLKDRYKKCGVPGMKFTVVQNGEFHLCRMSFRGMELGVVQRNKKDYLDLFDKDMCIRQKKEKINELMKIDYISACDYCSGNYGTDNEFKRVAPAEQI